MQYTNWINSTPSQQYLLSYIAQWLVHWVCNSGVASSSLTFGILTVNFSTGTRSFCVQWNHCTSRMRSQSQLRNDKYIMMQYTNWINSTPSHQLLSSCFAQWLEHWVCNPGVACSSLTFVNCYVSPVEVNPENTHFHKMAHIFFSRNDKSHL